MTRDFDPYHRWLGIPPWEQPADHYRLLGLAQLENDPEVIADAAERQIAHVRRYQLGSHSDLSQRILNELAAAKACLLDASKKAEYDARLQSAMTATPVMVPVPSLPTAAPPVASLAPPAVFIGPTPGQEFSRGWMARRRNSKSPVVDLVKIVLGAMGGLVIAYTILFLVFGVDILRLSNQKLSGSRDTTKAAVDPQTRHARANAKSITTGEEIESNASPPVNLSEPGAVGAALEDLRDASALKQLKPDGKPTKVQSKPPPLIEFNDQGTDKTVPSRRATTDTTPKVADQSSARLPPPSRDVQSVEIARINDLYHPERASSPAAKTQLAKQLVELADQSLDNQPERFVLLRISAELFCDGCDVPLMMQTIDKLAAEYAVSEPEVHVHVAKRLLVDCEKPERAMAFLRISDQVISRAMAVDKLDLAIEMADLSAGLCDRPAVSLEFRTKTQERQVRVRRIGEQFKRYEAALAELAADADDADAHATVGRWLCLVKGNWTEGLPHLKRGSEPGLKRLAEQDLLAADTAPDVLVVVGDAWSEMALSAEPHEQLALLSRADDCYRRAAEFLQGLAKVEVDRRREDISPRLGCLALDEFNSTSLADTTTLSPASAENLTSQALQDLFEQALAAGMIGNDFARAERLFSRCNQLDPQHVPTLNNLALISLRLHNHRRAVHLWETAARLAPQNAELSHNFQYSLRLAHANRLPMDRSVVNSLERLCEAASRDETPRESSHDGWRFMPCGQDESYDNSYTDSRCLHCGGTGMIPCNAQGCNNGTVGVPHSEVVGIAHNGTPIIRKVTVRQRCSRCFGRGQLDCPSCGGTGRLSF